MKRMVGTSVVDSKYVAVRGMPDRYVNTLLNGGRLPSTDPDKRAINVDLFPGSILESINTYKTFTPDSLQGVHRGLRGVCGANSHLGLGLDPQSRGKVLPGGSGDPFRRAGPEAPH